MTSSYLLLNGLRVHYLQWNVSSEGTPLVLLHGLASNARIWELTAPYLAQQGYSVFAPDARGHGLTDKPDGDYGFSTYSADLAAFIDACHLHQPVLIGHSWGANRAIDYAARFPVGPRAPSRLILVDGGIGQLNEPGTTWEQTRARLTPPPLAGTPLETFLSWIQLEDRGLDSVDDLIPIILSNFEITQDLTSGTEVISPRLTFERHMLILAAIWEFNTYELFARVRCPVLAVPAHPKAPAREEETLFLENKKRGVKRMLEILPKMDVHWMADTIHDVPMQRPAELASIITEFLKHTAP